MRNIVLSSSWVTRNWRCRGLLLCLQLLSKVEVWQRQWGQTGKVDERRNVPLKTVMNFKWNPSNLLELNSSPVRFDSKWLDMLQRCATSKSHCPCIWLRGPWIELRNPLFLRLFRSKQKQMKDATETVKVRDTWDRKSWGQWYLVTAWNCRAGARSTLGPCAPSSGVASGSSLTPQEISRKMKVKND